MSKNKNEKRGAGGTSGGIEEFFIALLMFCGGGYMLLDSMRVTSVFSMRYSLYAPSIYGTTIHLTTGMVLIPLMFGIGIVFYNSRNILGWLLSIGSLTALIFGVISSVKITMKTMSMFELMVIIVLFVGGLGMLLKSLKEHR